MHQAHPCSAMATALTTRPPFTSTRCSGVRLWRAPSSLSLVAVEGLGNGSGRHALVLVGRTRHAGRQNLRSTKGIRMESNTDRGGTPVSVSVLGLGILGKAIALRLHSQGCAVTVWTRSQERSQDAALASLKVAPSAAAAVGASTVVLLLLPDHPAIDSVLFPPQGPLHLEGKTVVQMGTISANQSRTLCAACTKEGAHYLEAPVQGSQGEAASGCLQIMMGAPAVPEEGSDVGRVLSLLGEQRIHVGSVGTAAALKLSLNNLLAMEQAAFSASLGVVVANGVGVDTFMDVLRGSAMHAKQFDKKLPKMIAHDYGNANFHTRHLLKDCTLFKDEAAAAGLITTPQEGLLAAVKETMERGFGDADYSSLYEGVGVPREGQQP